MAFLNNKKISDFAVTICVTVMLVTIVACSQENREFVSRFASRAETPSMTSDSVTTLISDSGKIRYRIYAAKWEIFDKASEPYWFFPKKVYLERFNDGMHIESTVQCDTARFYVRKKLWELKNNVKIMNLRGEVFRTQQLFWDQNQQSVYSDSFIRIEQKTMILSGIGFRSNQDFSKYTIFKPKGPMLMDSNKPDSLKMDPRAANVAKPVVK